MDTRGLVGACVMIVAIGTASAAVNAAQDPKETAAQQKATSAELTMTGCLEGPINTGDEYARSAKPARFRLTNVSMTPMPPKTAMYIIVGNDQQLSAQVGRQVRIVGTVVDPNDQDAGRTVTGTSGSTPVAATDSTVRARSVRRVADKCSPRR